MSNALSESRDQQALIEFLQGQDNPFSLAVEGARPPRMMRQCFVEEINQDIFRIVQAAVERYRIGERILTEEFTEDDLPQSGVAIILGRRGAGKTHLAHRLRYQEPQALVITPQDFAADIPFPEFLLRHLNRALEENLHAALQSDGTAQRALLVQLSEWLSRQLLTQAVSGLSDTEWLSFRAVRRFVPVLRRSRSHARELLQDRRALLQQLTGSPPFAWKHFATVAGVTVEQLRQLALSHVARTEVDPSIGGQIRARLYGLLVQLAFDEAHDRGPLFEFLEADFTQLTSQTGPSRRLQVRELLSTLIHLLLMFNHPAVFVFDALENEFDAPPLEEKCRPFFRGLAEFIEDQKGVPFFLLAEYGHWEAARHFMSNYVEQRFNQGIPASGHGNLTTKSLGSPSPESVRQLVQNRLAPLLKRFFGQTIPQDRALSPFDTAELARIASPDAGEEQAVRQVLLRLRNSYQRTVFGGEPLPALNGEATSAVSAVATVVDSPVDPLSAESLDDLWERECSAMERQISNGWSVLEEKLHQGTLEWLKLLAAHPEACAGWRIVTPELKSLNNQLAYGRCLRWRWEAGSEVRPVVLAYLLGARRGMPGDLESKLSLLQADNRLTLLWPHAEYTGEAETALPVKTRELWNKLVDDDARPRVRLLALPPDELAPLLTLKLWRQTARECFPDVDDEKLQAVAYARTAHLLPYIQPGA